MTSVIEAIDRNYNSGNRSQKASDIFDEVGASKTTRDAYIKDTQDYLDSLNKYPVGYKRAKEGLDAYNESQGKAGKELIKSTSLMQDFGSGLANVGKTALSIAGDVGFNVLISAGLTAAGKASSAFKKTMLNRQENLTEMGALSITMNSQQLDTELNNLQTYVKKRQQIMDDFANGSSKSKYGEKTYDELMSENDSAMQESLKNVNNYRQSIISIVTNQAISGAGENYSDMMAGIDYILNNIGGITSGQYFTNQDKSNMKNSNSLDTGYNSGHLKGYAKGTKHVGSNRIAMTNENGREIIVTKDGWITPLEASDMVIPNDITETLIDMAERQQNYAMNGNFKMPELKVKDGSGNSVNNVYNTFTVQGDLTRDTLPELNKILDLASSKTQNDIRKNKRRFG